MQRTFQGCQALPWSSRDRCGYSLGEMAIVIAVMGILAFIAVPVYSGIRTSSLQTAAMHSARLINAARDAYVLTVPTAATQWNASTSDADRLQMLISQNLLSGAPSDYLSMAGNYSVSLSGDVRSPTILTEDNHAIDY